MGGGPFGRRRRLEGRLRLGVRGFADSSLLGVVRLPRGVVRAGEAGAAHHGPHGDLLPDRRQLHAVLSRDAAAGASRPCLDDLRHRVGRRAGGHPLQGVDDGALPLRLHLRLRADGLGGRRRVSAARPFAARPRHDVARRGRRALHARLRVLPVEEPALRAHGVAPLRAGGIGLPFLLRPLARDVVRGDVVVYWSPFCFFEKVVSGKGVNQ